MESSCNADANWHLYVIRAGDESLYTGIATDPERRFAEHEASTGRGAKYLRCRHPLRLEFHLPIGSRSVAQRAEHRVKQLPKASKEALILRRPGLEQLLEMLGMEVPDKERSAATSIGQT